MKKFFFLFMAFTTTFSALAQNFSIQQADAAWDFEDSNTRVSLSNEYFLIPVNTVTGTGGSGNASTAYVAYIMPNQLMESTAADAGYNSRHCLYMMHPGNSTRTPYFWMMPTISDSAYSHLKLTGYVKKDDDATHSTELMIGYIPSLGDTAKANFASKVKKIGTVAMTSSWKAFEQNLDSVPAKAYVVLYNDDATKIFYLYADNIAFVSKGGTSPEPEPTPEPEPEPQPTVDSTITIIPGMASFEEYQFLDTAGAMYYPLKEDKTGYWQSGDYTFSCTRSYSGMMNDGFFAANFQDTTYTSYADDYKAITASAYEGTHYASMYYGGAWGGPCNVTCSERVVSGTYVTLALNPWRCIHGLSWCAAFAAGDSLILQAEGKKAGISTGAVRFALADYRDGKTLEADTWQWMNLSALGKVDEIDFTILDSQSGAGVGLYCCFDNFGGTAPTGVEDTKLRNVGTQKILYNGQILIRRGSQFYDIHGVPYAREF